MSRSTTTSREDIFFDALAITDTGTKTSNVSQDVGGINPMTLVINNSLNQAGNYQVQYSLFIINHQDMGMGRIHAYSIAKDCDRLMAKMEN